MCSIRKSLLLLVLTAMISGAATADPLRLVTSSWPPYVDEGLPGHGLSMEIVETAFKRAGYETTLVLQSWSRNLKGALVGVYDVVCTIWYTPQRAQELTYSEPYLTNEIRFVKRSGSDITFKSLDSLRGLRVGYIPDYAYGKAFEEATGLVKVPNRFLLQNLLLLLDGELDLTLDDSRVLRHQITHFLKGSSKELEIMSPPLDSPKLHIAVSKKNPAHEKIAADFNKALAAMKQDGTYEAILAKYDK